MTTEILNWDILTYVLFSKNVFSKWNGWANHQTNRSLTKSHVHLIKCSGDVTRQNKHVTFPLPKRPALKSQFWILVALHHICSWKALMKIFFSIPSLLRFLDDFFTLNLKLQQLQLMLHCIYFKRTIRKYYMITWFSLFKFVAETDCFW